MRRRIGSGAFATVWLAYDEQLDSPVAIKVLADNWAGDDHVRARFVEEGRFLRKVESPHVVSVYDAGELPDGRPYLVMTYADQGTLADRLELAPLSQAAPLTRAQALHVVDEVGAGLHALHSRGVLHRDVKPANVLFRGVDGHARAMVADLGLGKALDMSSRLTMIAGTPSFVAPEQARGEGLDARADEFSLAALAYLLLAGRPAYDHTSLSAAGDPPPPPPMGDEVSPELEAVVLRGLAADREERFADVPAFVAALAAATAGEERAPAPVDWVPADQALTQAVVPEEPRTEVAAEPAGGTGQARRRRWPWLVAGLVALVVGVAGGWVAEQSLGGDRVLQDEAGTISLTVPPSWTASVEGGGWEPPDSATRYAAISAGTRSDWRVAQDADGQGVFAGLLAGTDLPSTVPQHPECDRQEEPVTDDRDGDESVTVFFADCPGDTWVVERVVQVTRDQLLWVQVRSAERGTANRVLDGVTTHGM